MKKPEITGTILNKESLKVLNHFDNTLKSSVDEVKILVKTHAISDQHGRATGGEVNIIWEALYVNKEQNQKQKYPFDVKIEDYKGLDYIVSISLTDKLATFIINEG